MADLAHWTEFSNLYGLKRDQDVLIIAKNTPDEQDFTFYGKYVQSGFEESTQKNYVLLNNVFLKHEALEFKLQGDWENQMDGFKVRDDNRRSNFCLRFYYFPNTLDIYAVFPDCE